MKSSRLRVVFLGEPGSTFSLLHYAVLRAHTDVLLWVASRKPAANNSPARRAFVSFADWWERMRMRVALEWEALRLLQRPLTGFKIGTPVRFTSRDDTQLDSSLRVLNPDLIISAGFARLITPNILEIPRLGAFNCHPSPLPRYAGSNPWFWILRNGERETAVTIHRMVADADAGDMVAQKFFPIAPNTNHQQLYNQSSVVSARLLRECLNSWRQGTAHESPQDLSRRTFFSAPQDQDYRIDWSQSAEKILDLLRASSPAPCAWSSAQGIRFAVRHAQKIENGKTNSGFVLRADENGMDVSCGEDVVRIQASIVGGKELRGVSIARTLGLEKGDELK